MKYCNTRLVKLMLPDSIATANLLRIHLYPCSHINLKKIQLSQKLKKRRFRRLMYLQFLFNIKYYIAALIVKFYQCRNSLQYNYGYNGYYSKTNSIFFIFKLLTLCKTFKITTPYFFFRHQFPTEHVCLKLK